MDDRFTTLSSDELAATNGGGWKGKLAKGAWEFAKWTGIPSAVGAGAAWVQHQFSGPSSSPPDPQK